MPDTTLDPQAIAKAVAIEVADEDNQVGDFVEAIDLGDDVTDFRFETRVRDNDSGLIDAGSTPMEISTGESAGVYRWMLPTMLVTT